MGGIPAAGPRFGAAFNPDSVIVTSTMIDLIQVGITPCSNSWIFCSRTVH